MNPSPHLLSLSKRTIMSPISDPAFDPAIIEQMPASGRVRSRTSQKRLGIAVFLATAAIYFAVGGLTGTILAAKLALLAPDDKTALYGLATTLYSLTATVALILWGATSDLTRSRLGARAPWIIAGGVLGGLSLVAAALAQSATVVLLIAPVFGLLYGAAPAALLAVFPDRVPESSRGTMSAVYGAAQMLGAVVSGASGAQFISNPDTFIVVSAAVLMVGTPLSANLP
jgi:MFS family permease